MLLLFSMYHPNNASLRATRKERLQYQHQQGAIPSGWELNRTLHSTSMGKEVNLCFSCAFPTTGSPNHWSTPLSVSQDNETPIRSNIYGSNIQSTRLGLLMSRNSSSWIIGRFPSLLGCAPLEARSSSASIEARAWARCV